MCVCIFCVLQRKCEQYWPDVVGQSQIQPSMTIEVTLKELMPFADYEIRRFEVQDVSGFLCGMVCM